MLETSAFGANTMLTISTNVLLGFEGAVSGILAARLLGPHRRGEFAAVQTVSGFAATVAMLGMVEAVVYYCARDPRRAGRYIGSAAAIALLASIPVLMAAYILMPLALRAEGPGIIRAARWYLLMAPVYAMVAIPVHAMRGCGDFVAWNSIRLIPNFVWILVLMLAWGIALRSVGLLSVAYVAAQAVVFFPVTYVVGRRVQSSFLPAISDLIGMLRYGLPCTLTHLPQALNLRLDQLAMAMMLPPRELGFYAVAVASSSVATPVLSALAGTLLPAIASETDRARSADSFARGVRFGAMIACAVCVVLLALTPVTLVALFGESYRPGLPAAMVLVPAGAILGLTQVVQEGLRGLGHPYSVFYAELAGLVATSAGLALTLGPLGIMGGALSSLVGYSAVLAALLVSAHKHTGVSPGILLCPGREELQLGLERASLLIRTLSGRSA